MVPKRRNSLLLLTCAMLATALPALAQRATLDLSPGFDRTQATHLGNTGGDMTLTELAENLSANVPAACQVEDRYSSQQPDHLLNLPQELLDLRLTVNSNGKPTTLLVQDPQGRLFCGQPGGGFNEDSVLERSHWDAGEYQVWVSGANAGQQYRLSARE